MGVFEKRDVVGGGLCTEQPLFPGFLHNMHSNFHLWPVFAPAWDDLEIPRFGMKFVHPSIPWSAPLSNRQTILIHNQTRITEKSLSKFSRKDAKTYFRLKTDIDKVFKELVLATVYSVPTDNDPRVEKLIPKLPWYRPEWGEMSSFEDTPI